MSGDGDRPFHPRLGRVRSDVRTAGRAKSFLSKVRKATRQQQVASGRGRSAKDGSSGRSLNGKSLVASGRGVQRGRGAAFVRARNLSNGWSHRQSGSRRVVVKVRHVRSAGRNGKGAAHFRYIQRDGTSRDGERGRQLDIAPTLTIRPGFPVRVIVTRDLVLEPYRS